MSAARTWCVVGGGMLGLTMALRLAQAGQRVSVLEAGDRLGGLASGWSVGPVRWDRHYHVTLLSDLKLRALFDELGLGDALRWTTTKTDFYTGGNFFPLSNALDYLRFPPLGLIEKMRLAGTIFYASRLRDGQRLEAIPVGNWLKACSGTGTYEKIWLPLLRAKLGENYKIASASFIWAVIQRLYAARRSGLKTEMFGYLEGGYERVFERFSKVLDQLGVIVHLDCPVQQIEAANAGVHVTAQAGGETYDRAVVTVPSNLATKICSGLSEEELRAHRAITYQGIICPSVLLKCPLRGCYITYIADPEIPFTAVIEMSSLVDRSQFGGNCLAYLPWYVTTGDRAFNLSDAEIEERFLEALFRMYPHLTADDIMAFRVSRAREVLAVPTLNYSTNLPPMKTSIPGVSIVNSAHIVNGTLNVNETVTLAEDAAAWLLAEEGG